MSEEKQEYKPKPYTEAEMRVGEALGKRIDAVREAFEKHGLTGEELNKAVQDYFFKGICKIRIPK